MPSKIYKEPKVEYNVEKDLVDVEVGIWLAFVLQLIRDHTYTVVEIATSEEVNKDHRVQYVAINMVKKKYVPNTLVYFECINRNEEDPKYGLPQQWQMCVEPAFLVFLKQFKDDWPRRVHWSEPGKRYAARQATQGRPAFLDPIGNWIRRWLR